MYTLRIGMYYTSTAFWVTKEEAEICKNIDEKFWAFIKDRFNFQSINSVGYVCLLDEHNNVVMRWHRKKQGV